MARKYRGLKDGLQRWKERLCEMADISKEIRDFDVAEYGEEVRGSMISLAKKVNGEVETNTANVDAAIARTDTATQNAYNAAAEARAGAATADAAAEEAQTAADNADAIRREVQRRMDAGEFTGNVGPRGPAGKDGAQGASGVVGMTSGMFYLKLEPNGDLYAVYPEGDKPPKFRYDDATGNLYYVIEEE